MMEPTLGLPRSTNARGATSGHWQERAFDPDESRLLKELVDRVLRDVASLAVRIR